MKRAALTGIAGQDGTYLGRWLLAHGYEVHGLLQFPFDREEAGLRRRFSETDMNAVHWYTGSLEDPFSLMRFLQAARPEEIYHLAGLTDSRQSFLVPEEALLTITLGTLRLLEAARFCCDQARIFLASSSEVFGHPAQCPQDENTPMAPCTPYGIAKLAASQLAHLHRHHYGQFVTVGILYNHESPLRPANYLSSRVAKTVAAIKRGEAEVLHLTDLTAERDWSDARDFVRAYWLMLQADRPSDYILASGVRRRVADLVECAFQAVGLESQRFVRISALEQAVTPTVIGLCGQPDRAEKELGWHREWSFADTIADMVHAELENRPEIERANPLPIRRTSGHRSR